MSTEAQPSYFLYVGTFTHMPPHPRGRAEGIYVFRFDPGLATLTPVQVVQNVHSPSYLNLSPDGRHLYSVNAVPELDGQPGGGASTFAVDPADGQLTFLNHESSRGGGPCFVLVDRSDHWVLVTNFFTGSVAVLPIQADGRLGPASAVAQHEGSSQHPTRQAGPHAHSVNLDPAERHAVVCDLGIDQVRVYQFDAASGKLTPNPGQPFVQLPPGAGPRHLAFHPNGRVVYVIDEIDSTVAVFDYDAANGTLNPVQMISTLHPGYSGENSTADIHVHPNGCFVYGSNRGADTIAVFAADPESGRLTPIAWEPTRGKTPRNFTLDPSGSFLLAANQDSDNIVAFQVDPTTGLLHWIGELTQVPSPSCLKLWPIRG